MWDSTYGQLIIWEDKRFKMDPVKVLDHIFLYSKTVSIKPFQSIICIVTSMLVIIHCITNVKGHFNY